MLDLLPAQSYESFHGLSEMSSSWGGSILAIPDKQGHKYAMFAAEMTNNCTLRHWLTNSEVVLAVADAPTGPYKEMFQVIEPWAHNPEAIATKDGHVAIFTLGDGIPFHGPEVVCNGTENPAATTEFPPKPSAPPRRLQSGDTHTVQFTVHYAPLANGSFAEKAAWAAVNVSIVDFPVEFKFPGNWNPAPFELPDGRVRIMVHTGWSGITGNVTGWSGEVIVEADTWRGPFKLVSSRDITACTFCEEDPFMWQDHRGNWHVLYHRMFDNGTDTRSKDAEGLWSGGHSFSYDGLTWSPITRCYNTTVFLEGGGSQAFVSRERPKLILGPDGRPTHLSNAVQPLQSGAGADAGVTHTLVVALNVA